MLNWMTDVGTKLAPFAVRVNAGPPIVADEGEMELSTGTGLGAGAALESVHSSAVPLATTSRFTVQVVPVLGATCTPTSASPPKSCQ